MNVYKPRHVWDQKNLRDFWYYRTANANFKNIPLISTWDGVGTDGYLGLKEQTKRHGTKGTNKTIKTVRGQTTLDGTMINFNAQQLNDNL
jgi:hypothetical protein